MNDETFHSTHSLYGVFVISSTEHSRSSRVYRPCTLIETLYRENNSFRDRDLKRVTQCRIASKFSDVELFNILVSI